MARKRKQALTLMEMLIVIALIGIIGSALAYNLGAGLQRGKEFRAEQNRKKIRHILECEISDSAISGQEAAGKWLEILKNSKWLDRDQNAADLIKDANGATFEVSYDDLRHEIVVQSPSQKGP